MLIHWVSNVNMQANISFKLIMSIVSNVCNYCKALIELDMCCLINSGNSYLDDVTFFYIFSMWDSDSDKSLKLFFKEQLIICLTLASLLKSFQSFFI